MTDFDTHAIVDWTGGNDTGRRPRKDAIWAAVVRDGCAEAPVYLRNRQVACDWLLSLIGTERAAGRRLFAGFDFPFGYPRGFAETVTGTTDPLAVWDWMAENLHDSPRSNDRFAVAGRLNALFPRGGPFWFNGQKADVPHLPRRKSDRSAAHGVPERRVAELGAKGAFTCWQMGGAGAVGSQVMTGMATLARLRRAHPGAVAVWPFEALDRPVALVEVWPSLIADAVRAAQRPGEIRDAAQVRVLAQAVAEMDAQGLLRDVLAVPETVPEAAEEGWILGVGAEDALRRVALR